RPMHKRAVIGVWELQLFDLPVQFQPQKNLQLSLLPLHFVRPVTSKVAGLSPVAPAISINDLLRASYSDCNLLAARTQAISNRYAPATRLARLPASRPRARS